MGCRIFRLFGDLQPFADLLVGGENAGSAAPDDVDAGQLATAPDSLAPVQRSVNDRGDYRRAVGTVDTARTHDRALVAWLSLLTEDEEDGDPDSELVRREVDETDGLPISVVESLFHRLGG